MDYCYSCRRTLNGALVCPGCGAYAPDIAPPPAAYRGDAGPAPAPWRSPGRPHGHAAPDPFRPEPYGAEHRHDQARAQAAAQAAASFFDEAPGPGHDPVLDEGPAAESVLGPASIAPTLHRGRAARRRQMERWKKNRRRAAAATAVALFGGGVTVASMQSHSGKGSPSAASADNPVVPTSLHTDTASSHRAANDTGGSHADTQGAPQAGTPAQRPDVRTTHPSTDSVASIPQTVIPSSRPVSYTVTTRPAPHSAAAPAPTTTTAPSAPSDYGSGTSADAPSGGSGSTATTPPPQQQQPAPPASSTPSTPPPQQLCLLIICLG